MKALAPAAHSASGVTLHAAAARDPERAAALEPERVHDSYRDLVNDPTVDAVYIALSNDLHVPWILASLEAGKHVLCEKPLAVSAEDCQRAFAAAEAHGKLLVEATWVRWHPRHRRADALLGNGAHGRVHDIDARFTFNGVADANYRLDAAKGGGALLDLGPYVLAPVVDWGGEECSVSNAEFVLNDRGADLTTTATLKTESATASVEASFISPEHQGLRVAADDLSVTWVGSAFTNWHAESSLDLSRDGKQWSERFAPCDAYQLMLEHVSRAIDGDEGAYVPSSTLSLRTASLIDDVRHRATP
jgi:xylose dehydrogenase (NAD/NADP)